MNVDIRVIPHAEHRKEAGPTVGDWWLDNETMHIRVSECRDENGDRRWDMEMLIAHHEFTEAFLAYSNGVTCEDVDEFDSSFRGEGEPGDDPNSPYYDEHQIATGFERILAQEIGTNWNEYDEAVQRCFVEEKEDENAAKEREV